MADKKLNEVTKVTDMAYVPVIMADGSIGQIAKAGLASVVAGQMKYNASKMVLDFRTSTTTDVTLPSYGMVLLSIVYGSELYGLYLIQCWDGVISIKTINESATKKFQLVYKTYQKYITITSPSAVTSVRLGWINITD